MRPNPAHRRQGRGNAAKAARVALITIGIGAMAYAVVSAVTEPDFSPGGHLAFLAAVLVAHDGLLLPAVLAVGALFARYLPPDARALVQAGLIVSAAVAVVAIPLVLGYGRPSDNPSDLPLDYPRGLLLTLAAIWATVAVLGIVRAVRRRVAGTIPPPG